MIKMRFARVFVIKLKLYKKRIGVKLNSSIIVYNKNMMENVNSIPSWIAQLMYEIFLYLSHIFIRLFQNMCESLSGFHSLVSFIRKELLFILVVFVGIFVFSSNGCSQWLIILFYTLWELSLMYVVVYIYDLAWDHNRSLKNNKDSCPLMHIALTVKRVTITR